MNISEKLTTIAENEQRVYDAGYAKGAEEGSLDLPPFGGDCTSMFTNSKWDWLINAMGDQLTTADITIATQMLYKTQVENIPFQINMSENALSAKSMLDGGTKLNAVPRIHVNITEDINNSTASVNIKQIVAGCQRLRDIENLFNAEELSALSNIVATNQATMPNYSIMCSNCYSLRKLPSWYKMLNISPNSTIGNDIYANWFGNTPQNRGFNSCYSLDEITDFPIIKTSGTLDTNSFSSTVSYCNRLKNFIFEMDNGTPFVKRWKSQTIDFSVNVGYADTDAHITGYNSGITLSKKVTTGTQYQALKNDPDWWTASVNYSRYDHTSAVLTINSLPDTSAYLAEAGGTNTIKFQGECGSSTDGGAINTLTPEEIAVATAKGWTVTLV